MSNLSHKISVIVPVSERVSDVNELYREYKTALDGAGYPYEFIYVLDGDFPAELTALHRLMDHGEKIKVITLSKWFGEAIALSAGFENSDGDYILTLPAYHQVKPSEVTKLIAALAECDMAVAVRWPRTDAAFNQLQGRAFHWIVNRITGANYKDLGCGARALKRQIVDEVPIYGDQHRFIPLLAAQKGFKVHEVELSHSEKDLHRRIYRPGIYLRRLLDVLTVFFLVKFTKKPLRFFGLIGSGTFIIGGILLLGLVVERLFGGIPLADRPALLLSALMVVLGVQLFAMGLIGELIIFTHAKDMKEYNIEKIVND